MATFDGGRVQLPVRLRADTYRALREYAYYAGTGGSMNAVVNRALVAFLSDPAQRDRLSAAKADHARRAAAWGRLRHPDGNGRSPA